MYEMELLNTVLGKLIKVINHLPYSANIKSALLFNVSTDFIESFHFDDDSSSISFIDYRTKQYEDSDNIKFTRGIRNYTQANRYVYNFTKAIKHVNKNIINEIFSPYDFLRINKKDEQSKISYTDISKYTFLKTVNSGIYTDEEFEELFYKICEKHHKDIFESNKQARESNLPNSFDLNKILLDRNSLKISAQDELEFMLCDEAINHCWEMERHGLPLVYDTNYFYNFINLILPNTFRLRLLEKLTDISGTEAALYLYNSNHQLVTYIPELRFHEIFDRFWQMYTFPDKVIERDRGKYLDYVENILIPYKDSFELFRDTVEHLNKYFKDTASYISEVINREWDYPHVDGMANNELNESNRSTMPDRGQNQVKTHDLNASSKSGKINRQATIPVAFTYVSFVRNSSAIADLFDSLFKNRFIGSDANKRDFIRIFDNSLPNQPIKWIGTFSELVYFVKLLHSTHKFINPVGNNIWKVTSTLFVDKDGKTYDYLRFKGQKKPSKTTILEKIVLLLK